MQLKSYLILQAKTPHLSTHTHIPTRIVPFLGHSGKGYDYAVINIFKYKIFPWQRDTVFKLLRKSCPVSHRQMRYSFKIILNNLFLLQCPAK